MSFKSWSAIQNKTTQAKPDAKPEAAPAAKPDAKAADATPAEKS